MRLNSGRSRAALIVSPQIVRLTFGATLTLRRTAPRRTSRAALRSVGLAAGAMLARESSPYAAGKIPRAGLGPGVIRVLPGYRRPCCGRLWRRNASQLPYFTGASRSAVPVGRRA